MNERLGLLRPYLPQRKNIWGRQWGVGEIRSSKIRISEVFLPKVLPGRGFAKCGIGGPQRFHGVSEEEAVACGVFLIPWFPLRQPTS